MNNEIFQKMTGRIEMMRRDVADIQRLYRLAGFEGEFENPNIPLGVEQNQVSEQELILLQELEDIREKVNTTHTMAKMLLLMIITTQHSENKDELTQEDVDRGMFLTMARGAQPADEPVFQYIGNKRQCSPVSDEWATIGLV
jgi:hypothetical protein